MQTADNDPDFDLVLLGAGLASCLVAVRLQQLCPALKVVLLEQGTEIGSFNGRSHTWSFHTSDICDEGEFASHWLRPFVSKVWDQGYQVRFPKLERTLPLAYASCRSEDFHRVFLANFKGTVRWGANVTAVKGGDVTLATGQVVRGRCVIDGRGQLSEDPWPKGYQKFVGAFVKTKGPHGISQPVIMDATVPQKDGFRFIYVLPFSEDQLLVEDTYYSLNPHLDQTALLAGIANYLELKHISIDRTDGIEVGVLPIPLYGDDDLWIGEAKFRGCSIGMRGGFFHPVTGYSLVSAVKVAEFIAKKLSYPHGAGLNQLAAEVRAWSSSHWRRGSFLRRLNNMFFLAGAPDERYKIIQKFYCHGCGLIRRFYGHRLRLTDRMLILTGKPPVPIFPALLAFTRRVRQKSDSDESEIGERRT